MILSDEGLQKQLTEYASTLADIPDFLDQVKERIELLVEEGKGEAVTAKDYSEELQRVEDEQRIALGVITQDFNTIVKLAIDAGVPAEKIRGMVVSRMATENPILGAASGRAAF